MTTSLLTLQQRASAGEKLAVLTAYDASFAALLESCGIDALLVGDSLGMVLQGQRSTLPVRLADMVYHTASVARGATNSFIIADLPFGSYQASPAQAFEAAAQLMAAGAHCVKLEGGAVMVDTVAFLSVRGIPVCAHLGLLPQSVNTLGGYKVQGKSEPAARQLLADALALQQAGAGMVVLEAIPTALAAEVTLALHIPTIGIGAGADCSGQVLVLHDMLGVTAGKPPRFVRNFMMGADSVQAAVSAYVKAVKSGEFPAPEHCF
ncbi:3-methyl-2-oxobutanoate hydroxymethyltransferase [Sulfuriferula sp.]|uniref:3-methyl-2-oxobutanoate hydroxymethyltransferase n=1 Tax=Sulfuriferula sp. TaxID=2025307 RepID=UPI00272FB43A|nr:3-methyl-2-oxobutanoate hydroxymethyltransferase [Sulfuriferula sp.]MDP2025546.1 3-methyl-2-oxobutanoate hydroxymethyltransferase [Sulfuriferula sp.]